jgi:hypothetical protein
MVELQDLAPQAQFDELILADLKYLSNDFAEVLHSPTPEDVDTLIDRYSTGSPKQQNDLITLLSVHPVAFSDVAWSWLESFAKQGDDRLRGIVFSTLARADANRFGQKLLAEDWSWNPEEHLWVNHYGTGALIEATRALPFDQVVTRLAPWRILEAARLRGADPTEVRLAAEIFGTVLTADKIEVPDAGSDLLMNRAEAKSFPFIFSVLLRQEHTDDPLEALSTTMDIDAQVNAQRRAAETAAAIRRPVRTLKAPAGASPCEIVSGPSCISSVSGSRTRSGIRRIHPRPGPVGPGRRRGCSRVCSSHESFSTCTAGSRIKPFRLNGWPDRPC